MPPHSCTRRLYATISSVLVIGLMAGCSLPAVTSGDPFPDPPHASLDELLGLDRGADGALFDDVEHLAELLDVEQLLTDADAKLTREIGEQLHPDADTDAPQAQGAITSPMTVTASWSSTATHGVDQPVSTSRTSNTAGERDGRPYTSTTTDTNTVSDQREVTVHEVTTVSGDPAAGDGATEKTTVTQQKEPCATDGEAAGTWKVERAQSFVRPGGAKVEVNISTSGTVVRGADGTVTLRDVTTEVSGGGTNADGTAAPSTGFTVNAEIGSWDTRADITDSRGTWTVADATGFSDADAIALAGADLDAFQGAPADVAGRGQELRDSGGICVRIVVDSHGVRTLADGEKTDFDARVIDPKTGEAIDDAPIAVDSFNGPIAPRSASGHGTFTLTASGDPVYRVSVSTTTPRGGHAVQLQYGAEGWRFDGVSYAYTIPTHTGEQIPATITWSGEVCGDVTGEWKLSWQITSIALPSGSGTMRAVEVSQAPGGDRAVLLYELVDDPAPRQPPFLLWIDDANSATIPSHQRVEVHPEAMAATCVEG